MPLLPYDSLHITIQADQFLEATAQPIDVGSTRGQKEHPQALVFVVRVLSPRGPVAKDTNRPIAIQKTAGQRYEERVRNIDSPERQALARREPSRQQPVIESDVRELRVVRALSSPRPADGVLDGPAEAGKKRLYELSIAAREDDVPPIAR